MRRFPSLATLLVAVALAGCPRSEVPHPLAGQTRYLCCNLHYEEPEINDANYLRGALVPFGTRVDIVKVRRNRVTFQPVGHPALTLALKFGEKNLTMEQYLDRLFLTDDPRTQLASSTGRDKKQAAENAKRRKLIDEGIVQKGMTKREVLMALGYPPAHRTPSLESSSWTYWQNRWATMVIHFDGDKVSRIER